jgi:hypothetical protein
MAIITESARGLEQDAPRPGPTSFLVSGSVSDLFCNRCTSCFVFASSIIFGVKENLLILADFVRGSNDKLITANAVD